MPFDSNDADNDVGLLDILLIVALHWRVLMFGPLVVGLATYALVTVQPERLVSNVDINLTPEMVASLLNDSLLDKVLREPQLGGAPSVDDVSAGLGISPARNPDETRISLSLVGEPSVDAILNGIAEEVDRAAVARVRQPAADAIEKQLQVLQNNVDTRRQVVGQLRQRLSQSEHSAVAGQGAYATIAEALSVNLAGMESAFQRNADLERQLADLPDTYLLGKATRAKARSHTSTIVLALLAAIGTGFVLLASVFTFEGLRQSSRDQHASEKLRAIKNAFWRGRPPNAG